jgi:hypothetical protein
MIPDMSSLPSIEECESISRDYLQCLIKNRNDREVCDHVEKVLSNQCTNVLSQMKGVPSNTTYCVDQMIDYAQCSQNLNTSMCSSQYTQLHECKLKRRRFLFGEDLGLVSLNPQARKRW